MFDTENDPQPSDPPTNTGGGSTAPLTEDAETGEALNSEPPTNTGGGSNR